MTMAERDMIGAGGGMGGGLSACPACVAAPSAERIARLSAQAQGPARIMLSIPAAHCAACISTTVEGRLAGVRVTSSRLN